MSPNTTYDIRRRSELRLGCCLAACLVLSGCGLYADFTLPPLTAGPPALLQFDPQPGPVIARGERGEWDSRDVLNPSVVRLRGTYYNFYSGFDGNTWHTGLATSSDGLRWRKEGLILSPDRNSWEDAYIAANGTALVHQGRFYYWYQAGPKPIPRIGLAWSDDGRRWKKHPAPVLATGPRGSWDERGVADPYVIRIESDFYMFYLGQDRARRQRLGVARSRDGVRWEKMRRSPVLELGGPGSFDEVGLGEPAVWILRGSYWMLYTGRDRSENRRMGLARSQNGVDWVRLAAVYAGSEPWNRTVLCDPSVEVEGDIVRVWFGGGDAASPDENLNGQIGFGILRPADVTLTR